MLSWDNGYMENENTRTLSVLRAVISGENGSRTGGVLGVVSLFVLSVLFKSRLLIKNYPKHKVLFITNLNRIQTRSETRLRLPFISKLTPSNPINMTIPIAPHKSEPLRTPA